MSQWFARCKTPLFSLKISISSCLTYYFFSYGFIPFSWYPKRVPAQLWSCNWHLRCHLSGLSPLCESKTTTAFSCHCNLRLNFQIKFEYISSAFESRLAGVPISVSEFNQVFLANSDPNTSIWDGRMFRIVVYKSAATAAWFICIRRCWSGHVLLAALTHRFVRLSFQLIALYSYNISIFISIVWLYLFCFIT